MSDYTKAIEANDEPHIEIEDDGDASVSVCPKCSADLFEVGIIEGLSGGYSETEIHFVNGKVETGITSVQDFDEQWALCGKCGERVEHPAIDIIEAFERLHPPESTQSLDHTGGNKSITHT